MEGHTVHEDEPEYIETDDDEEPIVVAMHNDLVLCCATMSFQRDYYICNPYTKQFVQIPPTPRCHEDVRVGFICSPYYNEALNRKPERIIQVDVDFRFAIARIVPRPYSDQYCSSYEFDLEIFSSETGRWTQSVVKSPREFCLDSIDCSGGIAYNGMLYWWSAYDGFIIGLNPYNYSSKNDNYPPADRFHSIAAPKIIREGIQGNRIYVLDYGRFSHVSVSRRGRLRFCHFMNEAPDPCVRVWELEDDEWCSCLTGKVVSLSRMFYADTPDQLQLVHSNVVLAFDPSDDGILYLQLYDRIVICNLREGELIEGDYISRSV